MLNFLHLVRKPRRFFRTVVVVVVAAINSSRQDGQNLVSCIVGVNLLLFSLQYSSRAEERRDKAGAPVGLCGGG